MHGTDLIGALLGGVRVEAGGARRAPERTAEVASAEPRPATTVIEPSASALDTSTSAPGTVEVGVERRAPRAAIGAGVLENGMTPVAIGAGSDVIGGVGPSTAVALPGGDAASVASRGAATVGDSRSRRSVFARGEGAAIDVDVGATVDTETSIARRRVGRGVRFGDLVASGWTIDGARVSLDDFVALAGTADASIRSGGALVGAGEPALAASVDASLLASGSVGAWAELEHVELPTAGGDTRLVVRVVGLAPSVPRARLRVHLVLDRSSSMDGNWDQVLVAARQLVGRLAADDILQVVVYADRAEEVFGPAPVGDGREALTRLERVSVGGGTNIEAGISLAYRSIARIPDLPGDRSIVFLVSDGRPNIGAFAADDFARLTVDARARGCATAVFGLGDEFDGDVLRAIARAGRGSYYVARTAAELSQPLVNELGAHERVAGLDVRVRVRLPAAVALRHVEGADSSEAGNVITATFPVLRVGEERRVVLSLGVRASVEPRDIAAVDVGYRARPGGVAVAGSRRVRVVFGAGSRYAGASVGASLLDQDLARSLDEAGTAIRVGDGERASRVLASHVERVRARPDLASLAPVRARTDSVARLATGVAALMPQARGPERRLVGLALGSRAVRLGR